MRTLIATAISCAGLALLPAPPSQAIEEDEPGWSCVDDGNRVCGPDNPEGKPAGCYDLGGVLIAAWPCAPHSGTGARPGA